MKRILLFSLLLLTKTVFAQVPVNDVCANATLLTTSTTCSPVSGTLANATTSTLVPSCASVAGVNSDVFYRFVANATTASITVTPSSGMDPVITAIASCGGTSLGCRDGYASGTAETLSLTGLTIGNSYFIQVADYAATLPSTYTFTICVVSTPAGAPANDECANATLLTTSTTCSPVSGTLANATTSTITPSCTGSKDVFYKFVANAPTATVTVTGSAGLDVRVATFSSCGSTSFSCVNSTYSGETETVSMSGLTVGNTYYIKVQDWMAGAATTYTFTICVVSIPGQFSANDECATATLLTPSTSCSPVSGTLSNATTSTATTGCSGYNDVFYKFVATSTDVDITLVPSATLDPKLSIFSTCGSTSLSCVDLGNAGDSEFAYVNNLTVGATYYIKVANFSATMPATPTFSICVKTVVRPSNDECVGAITLTPSSTCNVTTGTFFQASTSTTTTGGCGGTFDVFYKFVATSSSTSITATPSTGTDIRYALLTSCGGSSLLCVNNASSGLAESQIIDNLTVGTTYFIKLSTGTSVVPISPAFTICVQNQPVPAVPSNDECSGATTLVQSSTCSVTQGSLLGATTSTITPSCVGYKDVFYKFVATATSANVEVTSSAGLDATVSIHNTCGGPSLYCINGASNGGVDKLIVGSLVVGTTYYIKVASSVFAPSTNTFTICVLSVPRPVNDECSGATSLTPSSTCNTTSGSLLNASPSNILATCASGTSDVFYKFVASSTAVSIGVAPSAGIDPVVAAYTSCGGSSLGCSDKAASGAAETLTLTGLTIGITYYVQVQNYGSSLPSTTDFTICVQNVVLNVPVNDECVNATTLTPSTTCTYTAGTLLNSTTSTTIPYCQSSYNSDVFYKFVANATSASVTVAASTGLDPIVAVYSSCGGSSVGCVDGEAVGTNETLNLTGLTIGSTYFIQVADYSASLGSTPTFSICVVSTPAVGPPPANDVCANAINLISSTACTQTSGTLFNATNSALTVCPGNYDVFYKFTAAATTTTVTVRPSSTVDAKVGVFTSCSATNFLACVDEGLAAGISEVATLTNLTVGTQYFIKVSEYWSTTPTSASTFTICVQTGTPTTTATQNSTALSAISLYPNPTQNVLNIENVSVETKVELIDLTGKTIFVQDLSTDTQVDLSNYSAGVYILKLTSGGVSENRRVVLSK